MRTFDLRVVRRHDSGGASPERRVWGALSRL